MAEEQKPSAPSPVWPPIIIAVITVIGSIAVAYITTGKTFDSKLEALKTEITTAQSNLQEVKKKADETKVSLDKLSKQLEDVLKRSDFVTVTQLDARLASTPASRIQVTNDGFIIEGQRYKRRSLKICADPSGSDYATKLDGTCDSIIVDGKPKYSRTIDTINVFTKE